MKFLKPTAIIVCMLLVVFSCNNRLSDSENKSQEVAAVRLNEMHD